MTLSVWVKGTETTLSHPVGGHHAVKTIGVRIVNIVVDTALVLVPSWLPELGDVVVSVISIKEYLGEVSNEPKSNGVGLTSRVE